jgi:hypothetical protein
VAAQPGRGSSITGPARGVAAAAGALDRLLLLLLLVVVVVVVVVDIPGRLPSDCR